MNQNEFERVLYLHEMWLLDNTKGKKADLSGLDLSRLDFSDVDLSWANLSGVNLYRADLSTLDLGAADLSEANLRGADFNYANLSFAKLYRADLRGANLSGADLSWANLCGANLSEVDLNGVTLRGANLDGAKGFYQFGPVKSSRSIVYCNWWPSLNTWICQDWHLYETLDQLEKRVRASHNCPSYLLNIELLKNWKYE